MILFRFQQGNTYPNKLESYYPPYKKTLIAGHYILFVCRILFFLYQFLNDLLLITLFETFILDISNR